MDTRIEWKARRRWDILTDDDAETLIAFVHEGGDDPDDFSILPAGPDPSLLADLQAERYASLDRIAAAVGLHLEGTCRIT